MTKRPTATCPACHGMVSGVGRQTLEEAMTNHQPTCPAQKRIKT